jgi:site-specific recombinase XerC
LECCSKGAKVEPAQSANNHIVEQNERIELPRQLLPIPQDAPAGITKTSNEYVAFLAKQLSPQTRRAYAADMKHFLTAVRIADPKDLLAVDTEMLIEYRNSQIDEGLAPATIARRLSTLRSFFDLLVTLGRIKQNPANPKLVRNPRVPKEGVTSGIEPHEARELLGAPDTSKLIGKRDRAILAVGLYMALRRAEIASLTKPVGHSGRTGPSRSGDPR